MKDTFMRLGFYLLYAFCTVGVFLGVFWNQSIMIPFCMVIAVVGVVFEVRHFSPKWPVIGSDDYNAIVDKFRNSISDNTNQGILPAQEEKIKKLTVDTLTQ
jgi:hypothetical protein